MTVLLQVRYESRRAVEIMPEGFVPAFTAADYDFHPHLFNGDNLIDVRGMTAHEVDRALARQWRMELNS